MLHNSPLDSFSEREFLILQKLREECIDFQEDLGWGINCCKDPVYLSLREKPRSTLSTKELHYLEQLEDDCEELKEDLEAGYSRLWPSDSAILNDTLSVYYDSPGTGKKFLVIGGLLLVPGLVMPIAGSSILSIVILQIPGIGDMTLMSLLNGLTDGFCLLPVLPATVPGYLYFLSVHLSRRNIGNLRH